LGVLSGRSVERRETGHGTDGRLQGRVEEQMNIGNAQRTDESQSNSELLTRNGHHEHGVTNTFDNQATRTRCKHVAERVHDEKHIETGVKGLRSYPKRRRSQRQRDEVGDDAVMKIREEAILEVEPGWRGRDDDAPRADELVRCSTARRS